MSLDSSAGMPAVLYLDGDKVDNDLVYRFQGRLETTIQNISEEKGVSGEAGGGANVPLIGRLKAAISAHYTEGEEVEFIKQIDDPIAKFALLMEVLEESPEIVHIDEKFELSDREKLDAGDFVAIHGGLKRTPLKEIADMLDFVEDIQQFQQGLDELSGLDMLSEEDQEELDSLRDETEGMSTAVQGMQRLLSAFSREDNIYRAVISDESDVEFVLIPNEENFQNLPMDFPSVDNDYLILGKVQTKFNKGDSVELINFSQLVSGSADNPRQKKTQEKQKRMRFSKMASDHSSLAKPHTSVA
jgi:hypothetical protein